MTKNSGSSLTQYSIVVGIALVVIAIAFSGVGQGITSIFTDYYNSYKSMSDTASSNLNQLSSSVNSRNSFSSSNGVSKITHNDDGSASFTTNGQNITLSREMLELQDMVMETSGSAAIAEELADEIAYLINKYKKDYPDEDVPVDILFGQSQRSSNDNAAVYEGLAEVNSTAIKVGNHLVVLSNDQTCTDCNQYNYQGKYRLEGTIDSSGNFQANVTSELKNADDSILGNYTATVDTSNNGISFTGTSMLKPSSTNTPGDYAWELTFIDPDKQFHIK